MRWKLDVFSQELQLFRFAVGSGLYSLLILALTAAHLAYTGVFVAAGLAVIIPAFRIREERLPLPDFSHAWKFWFGLILIGFGIFYFVNALAPETSPDGTAYHLGVVARYFRQHSLGHITTSFYANLSEGLEMLFLAAFSLGRHSAATLIEFAALLGTPLVMVAYSQRFGFPKVGVTAAIIMFCCPVFAISGSSAYNDAAAVLILFSLFYALQIWDSTRQTGMLVVAGMLAGFSYGIKYSAFLATPYCIGFVIWKLYRAKQPVVKPLLIVGMSAFLLLAPWWIKNWIIVDNPLSPFGNKIFANHYVTPRFENEYIRGQKPTGPVLDHLKDVTILGGLSGGFLGPLFLLTPLGLLALRYKQGRQVLLLGALLLLPAFANVQTRFLLLPAPFAALALCLAVWKSRGALIAFILAAPVLAVPSVADDYCLPWAWRLHSFPVADAFRTISEDESLNARLGGYKLAQMINKEVPPNGKIFSMAPLAEAYINRDVWVSYESAIGEDLRDFIYVALTPDYHPAWIQTFKFSAEPLRSIRVVQTADGGLFDEWSIGEVRILHSGNELSKTAGWRLSASVNPWDVNYAFDHNPVTRWGSRTGQFSGQWVQVDFEQPMILDSVELDCSHGQWGIRLRLEGQDAAGKWKPLGGSPEIVNLQPTGDLRRAAIDEFKKHGITHLVVSKGGFGSDDIEKEPDQWGVTLIGKSGDDWLYAIN